MTTPTVFRLGRAGGGLALSAWPALGYLSAAAHRLHGWRRLVVAFVLGTLAVLALPPLHIVPAMVPACVGVVWLLQGAASLRASLAIGYAFGFGYFVAGLYWVANALLTRPEEYGLLAPFAPLGLAAILAPFFLVPAAAIRLAKPGTVGEIALFAGAWTVAEWLRTWVLSGFPWNLIGTVWSFTPTMLQLSAVTGVLGLSLVTVLAATMPAVLAGPATRHWPAWTAVGVAYVLLGLVAAFGATRLADVGPVETVDGVRLRLVQPNIPQSIKWRRDLIDAHVLDQVRLGSEPAAKAPTHVIWSEVAAPLYFLESASHQSLVAAHTPPDGLTILGTLRRTPPEEPFQLWNSLVAIDSTGTTVAQYDKSHLVPFGEFMPLGGVLGLANLTIGFADFSAGAGVTTLALPGTPPVSPLICYEAIFPGAVADPTNRPGWLLNITNDGWYGRSAGPYQHFAAAQMRAVEEGLPLVRVANTGISGVVDAYGRVLAKLDLGARGVLDSDLPRATTQTTPYARFGNLPILLVSVLLCLGGALSHRRL